MGFVTVGICKGATRVGGINLVLDVDRIGAKPSVVVVEVVVVTVVVVASVVGMTLTCLVYGTIRVRSVREATVVLSVSEKFIF